MKLFILQTTIPDYRGKFFSKIREKLGDEFRLIRGLFVNILILFFSKGGTKSIFLYKIT